MNDYEKKGRLALLTAAASNPEAQFELGNRLANGVGGFEQDLDNAVMYLHMAALKHHHGAKFRLCGLANSDPSVPQDFSGAMEWYRKKADQGDIEAKLRLASCYAGGLGTLPDYTEAVNCCRGIANPNDAHTQHLLGLYYGIELMRWCLTAPEFSTESTSRWVQICDLYLYPFVTRAEDALRKAITSLKVEKSVHADKQRI